MTAPGTGPRIALLEDHVLFAESLALALQATGYDVRRIPLPEAARSVTTVLPAVLRAQPRLVLVDLDLGPLGNGVRLIEPLVRAQIPVLVVTGNTDRVQWGECVRHGARRVVPKSTPLDEILGMVRRTLNGLPVMDLEERQELLRVYHQHQAVLHDLRRRLELLTRREQEVLGHLMGGRQVREIATICVVSEATVRTQVKSILAKLEVSSQLAAVGVAHQADWQSPLREEPSRLTELGYAP